MNDLPKSVIRRFPGQVEIALRAMFAVLIISVALVVGGLLSLLAAAFGIIARVVRKVLAAFR